MAFFFEKSEIEKVNNLLLKANAFTSYEEALELIRTKRTERFVISFLNMYAIQLSLKDDEFYNALLDSDLLLVDGIALKILYRIKHFFYGINMNGSDFIPAFINDFNDSRYLVFASDEDAIRMFRMKHNHLRLVSCLNGFHDFDRYVAEVKSHKSDIILLGMGMPKQEKLSNKINSNHIIINGGAIIDYMAGYKTRAPSFFIEYKLEWLYRILYEPDRLFRRYAEGFFVLLRIILTDIFVNENY